MMTCFGSRMPHVLGSTAGLVLALGSCAPPAQSLPRSLILWASERPEDLRFLPAEVAVAAQTGFVEIAGNALRARGRRFPLLTARSPETAMVHLQIDEHQRASWSPDMRRRVAAAVLHYATGRPTTRVQIDFEVRASERQILLDVLADVRRALPVRTALSMTALASWCDGEAWLDAAPVDEIVPMMFRMGRSSASIRRRFAEGGDLSGHRCRAALAISTDEPIARAPPNRQVYVFNPRSWREQDLASVRQAVERWR